MARAWDAHGSPGRRVTMRWDVHTERVNDGVKQMFSDASGAYPVERELTPPAQRILLMLINTTRHPRGRAALVSKGVFLCRQM